MKFLTAVPVYNEERSVEGVLAEVRRYSPHILVVNDGSTDRTPDLLARQEGVEVVTHPRNRGYGAALISAFEYALAHDYQVLVTMDCATGLHEPATHPGCCGRRSTTPTSSPAAATCATSARTGRRRGTAAASIRKSRPS